MTDNQIRHILSGIKEEIRREKDRERRVHLAIMGLFWTREFFTKRYCEKLRRKFGVVRAVSDI